MQKLTEPKKARLSGPRNYKIISRFQQKVYNIVKKIPKGKTTTYKAIAKQLKTSPRAIGQALKRNYDKNIPCHRVIMSNGKIGGYNRGIKKKVLLLKKEGAI